MLKSYKKLDRWYDPLEPEGGAAPVSGDRTPDRDGAADGGPARYPDYIPAAVSASAEPDPAPSKLSRQRSEFTGGWADWVDGEPAGADPEHEADLVRFPGSDAELVDEPAPRLGRAGSGSAASGTGANRRRTVVVLIAAVVLLAVAAAVVLYLLIPGKLRATAPPADDGLRLSAVTSDTAGGGGAAGATRCRAERADGVVRGADRGGTGSGPEAILRFQYAYYVERSGAQARSVVAPDAGVQPAETIQAGIDSVPVGTEHCVRITTLGGERYAVEVTEYRPGGGPATYSKQLVTTAVIDGHTLITGIAAG